MKILRGVFLTLAAICGGCVSSGPKSEVKFAQVHDLQALAGCYTNQGEGQGVPYLSRFIWPKAKLDHSKVKAIRVLSAGEGALLVSAEAEGAVLKQGVFVEGRDFTLSPEGIPGHSGFEYSLAYPAGNVFIGLMHSSQTLGLDESGDARVQERSTVAGTAFLVIPLAGVIKDAYRFPRDPSLCK